MFFYQTLHQLREFCFNLQAASDWLFIVPWGLKKTLNYISKKYNNPKIYVTENGKSFLALNPEHKIWNISFICL